jgi:hypothetical protein
MSGRREIGGAVSAQLLNSTSNLLLTVGMARNLSAKEFAVFGLLQAAFLVLQGGSRAYASEAVLVGHGARYLNTYETLTRRLAATLAPLLMACVALTLALTQVLNVSQLITIAFLACALAVIGLAADRARYSLLVRGALGILVLSDAIWVGVTLLSVVMATFLSLPHGWVFIAAGWGAGAGACVALALHEMKSPLILAHSKSEPLNLRRIRFGYLVDFLSVGSYFQMITAVLFISGSAPLAGGMRAAAIFFGPVTSGSLGLRNLLQVQLSGRSRQRTERLVVLAPAVAAAGAATVVAFGLVWTPTSILRVVAGDSAAAASDAAPLTAAIVIGGLLAMFGIAGLRAEGRDATARWLRCIISVSGLTAAAVLNEEIGGIAAGTAGLAVGIFILWKYAGTAVMASRDGSGNVDHS